MENQEWQYEEEIDLRDILDILKKRWQMIALITLVAAIISAIASFFILQPIYESTSTILVGRDQSNYSSDINADVTLSQKLVNTYGEIIKTNAILDPVIDNLDLELTAHELSEKITVSPVGDTELIEIKVQDQDPIKASDISNEISTVFSREIEDIMKVDNVSIIEEAIPPENPIKPSKMLNIAIAAVLGMMVSVFVIFLREYLDNTVKTQEDVAKYLDLPVLASIPKTQE